MYRLPVRSSHLYSLLGASLAVIWWLFNSIQSYIYTRSHIQTDMNMEMLKRHSSEQMLGCVMYGLAISCPSLCRQNLAIKPTSLQRPFFCCKDGLCRQDWLRLKLCDSHTSVLEKVVSTAVCTDCKLTFHRCDKPVSGHLYWIYHLAWWTTFITILTVLEAHLIGK